ncbi:MAG TPA: porin family protein [Chitinophagaceae bacterium]|nr:porin family protein [Chitinophagaceae bacterium]
MKKIILLVAVVIVSTASFAQISIGLQATGNLSTANFKAEEGYDFKKKMKAMPGAGVVVQYRVNENWAVRSGVNYLKQGVKATANVDAWGDEPPFTAKIESDLNYLQVPLNAVYTIPVSKLQFFAGAGFFLNYGLSGKMKVENKATFPDGTESVYKEERDAFKDEDEEGGGLKRTDFGIGALAGVQFNKLFINVGYQIGLSDAIKEGDGKYKQRGLQLSVGYWF